MEKETKFKKGDRVLVRDFKNDTWYERTYITTISDLTHRYLTSCDEASFEAWKYIKPLENEVKCWEDLGYAYPEWATLEQQVANNAMMKLSQLMKNVNGDWTPNWDGRGSKFTIYSFNNEIGKGVTYICPEFLSFPTEEIRDNFLENHRELIMKARPLL